MMNDPYHLLLIALVDKFSRHLIIRIPKAAFKDNSHAGAFVSEVSLSILSFLGLSWI